MNNKEKLELATLTILDIINKEPFEDVAEVISKIVENSHRTLNQGFFNVMQQVIAKHTEIEYFDARNEYSVEWAKRVSKIDAYFPYI